MTVTKQAIKTIKLYPTRPNVELPQRATAYASGYDLQVYGTHTVMPGETKVIPTGLMLADVLPPGIDMQVRPRSSLALKHGLIVSNSPGTIDGDYTGEIGIIVTRLMRPEDLIPTFTTVQENGENVSVLAGFDLGLPTQLTHGMRIAQLVFSRLYTPFLVFTAPNSTREDRGGFGSTGA